MGLDTLAVNRTIAYCKDRQTLGQPLINQSGSFTSVLAENLQTEGSSAYWRWCTRRPTQYVAGKDVTQLGLRWPSSRRAAWAAKYDACLCNYCGGMAIWGPTGSPCLFVDVRLCRIGRRRG